MFKKLYIYMHTHTYITLRENKKMNKPLNGNDRSSTQISIHRNRHKPLFILTRPIKKARTQPFWFDGSKVFMFFKSFCGRKNRKFRRDLIWFSRSIWFLYSGIIEVFITLSLGTAYHFQLFIFLCFKRSLFWVFKLQTGSHQQIESIFPTQIRSKAS